MALAGGGAGWPGRRAGCSHTLVGRAATASSGRLTVADEHTRGCTRWGAG